MFVSGNDNLHFDGKTWTKLPVDPAYGVWGADAKHVYFSAWVRGTDAAQVVGWNGESAAVVARHWSGLTPLTFAAARDVGFAVGDKGLTFQLTPAAGKTK